MTRTPPASLFSRKLRVLALAAVFGLFATSPRPAHADPMREFVMSATYGVLAGTLVGTATLAFSDRPGDNLNKIARGASIGLYAGILLGLYIVYGVPGGEEEENPQGSGVSFKLREPPRLLLRPLISERGLEGAAASYAVLRF